MSLGDHFPHPAKTLLYNDSPRERPSTFLGAFFWLNITRISCKAQQKTEVAGLNLKLNTQDTILHKIFQIDLEGTRIVKNLTI